jgi:hypothetical protein
LSFLLLAICIVEGNGCYARTKRGVAGFLLDHADIWRQMVLAEPTGAMRPHNIA